MLRELTMKDQQPEGGKHGGKRPQGSLIRGRRLSYGKPFPEAGLGPFWFMCGYGSHAGQVMNLQNGSLIPFSLPVSPPSEVPYHGGPLALSFGAPAPV